MRSFRSETLVPCPKCARSSSAARAARKDDSSITKKSFQALTSEHDRLGQAHQPRPFDRLIETVDDDGDVDTRRAPHSQRHSEVIGPVDTDDLGIREPSLVE